MEANHMSNVLEQRYQISSNPKISRDSWRYSGRPPPPTYAYSQTDGPSPQTLTPASMSTERGSRAVVFTVPGQPAASPLPDLKRQR